MFEPRKVLKKLLPRKLLVWLRARRLYHPSVPANGLFYQENEPAGFRNFSEKIARVESGGPFEWPNMVALNQSIQSLIGTAKTVVVIGSGTATFEWYCTQADGFTDVKFVSSEFDTDCVEWCKINRSHPNIEYTSLDIQQLLERFGKFDLAVVVDVIEHVDGYGSFLAEFRQLADTAILTTPNRDRNFHSSISNSPEYYQHVREWNSGEFYWILMAFYDEVDLYAMPDIFSLGLESIGLMSTMTPLVAHCRQFTSDF